ncbi:unnamed protein product [Closterium sp. Naga37s-1]|nr:unnamed protein product [Closterium sp. Naga37s-1]
MQENEAANEEEEHEPVPEQAGENPDVLDGAEEGESEPTHETADSYEEAEEEEEEARRESRWDDPDRQEGRRVSDAQQQEQPSQADDMRELQVRGSRGGEEAERSRTSDGQRRRAEQRGVRKEGKGRRIDWQTTCGGRRREESRSPEPHEQQRGELRSPRQHRRWDKQPSEESRSPVRGRGREGRLGEARFSPDGHRWHGRGGEGWSPSPARRQAYGTRGEGGERSRRSPARRRERTERDGGLWKQQDMGRRSHQESRSRSGGLAYGAERAREAREGMDRANRGGPYGRSAGRVSDAWGEGRGGPAAAPRPA